MRKKKACRASIQTHLSIRAYALVWLAVSGKFLKSEIKLILMSAEAMEEEKKRMSAQMADTLKRMAEEVNIGSPLCLK